jgi:hypothetical protein
MMGGETAWNMFDNNKEYCITLYLVCYNEHIENQSLALFFSLLALSSMWNAVDPRYIALVT